MRRRKEEGKRGRKGGRKMDIKKLRVRNLLQSPLKLHTPTHLHSYKISTWLGCTFINELTKPSYTAVQNLITRRNWLSSPIHSLFTSLLFIICDAIYSWVSRLPKIGYLIYWFGWLISLSNVINLVFLSVKTDICIWWSLVAPRWH